MDVKIKSAEAITELEDIGKIIRKERMKQNLSIKEISETLRISEKFLYGIEDGSIEGTMAPVFIRGFIRSYAQNLNVLNENLDRYLREFSDINNETIKPAISEKKVTGSPKSLIRRFSPLLLLILGIYIVYAIWSGIEEGKEAFITEQKVASKDEVFSQYSSDFLDSNQEGGGMDSNSAMIKENQLTSEILEITPNTRDEVQSEAGNSGNLVEDKILLKSIGGQPPTEIVSLESVDEILTIDGKELHEPLQPPPPPMLLILTATNRTWVAVSVDKQEVVDIMLDAGQSHELDALERFHITMGNTASLHLMLDGREIEFDRRKNLLDDWIIESNP